MVLVSTFLFYPAVAVLPAHFYQSGPIVAVHSVTSNGKLQKRTLLDTAAIFLYTFHTHVLTTAITGAGRLPS